MKKTLMLAISMLALALLVTTFTVVPVAGAAAAGLDGKAIFMAQKCNQCHAVSSVGIEAKVQSEKMKGPDLAGGLEKEDAATLNSYLKKQSKINDKLHKVDFKGTDEELSAVIEWLKQQKKPA